MWLPRPDLLPRARWHPARQHWLNVQFEKSLGASAFRILTEEEEKKLSKSWKDIKKEHEKAFKK